MISLADWQTALTGVIDAEHMDPAGLGALRPVPGPSSEQGCRVYRNNSRGARGDAPLLDLEPLQGGDPSSICPCPVGCLAWMRSPWPVHEIWQAHQGHDEPPPTQIGQADWYLVIERRAYQPQIQLVDAILWTLLDACGQDMTIGEMSANTNQDVSRLGELVQRQWIGVLRQKGHVV